MGRILALDIGQKRIGMSVTDPAGIIATPLETLHVKDIWDYLSQYIQQQEVNTIVVGWPLQSDGSPSEAARFVIQFVSRFRKLYAQIPVWLFDERYTSVMAQAAIRSSGASKSQRQDKALVDKISATLLLQSYMEAPHRATPFDSHLTKKNA